MVVAVVGGMVGVGVGVAPQAVKTITNNTNMIAITIAYLEELFILSLQLKAHKYCDIISPKQPE
jgi:hypothetical protein